MMRIVPARRLPMTLNLLSEFSLRTLTSSSFPLIVQEGCANGTVRPPLSPHPQAKLKHILENDRCLFNGISIAEVTLPSNATLQQLAEYEGSDTITNEEHLQVLVNRGTFRMLSSSDDPADKFLVYTPNTLPYNPSAPLRNAVPYIPLQFTPSGVGMDPILPKEYVNPSVERFVNNINSTVTTSLLEEQRLIREQLNLDHIQTELHHLGSVIEDDMISLSPDAEALIHQFSEDYGIPVPEGLPPRSLKEIYQLPHKKNGKEEESEEKEERKKSERGNKANLDISKLLRVESTRNMSDVAMGEGRDL